MLNSYAFFVNTRQKAAHIGYASPANFGDFLNSGLFLAYNYF